MPLWIALHLPRLSLDAWRVRWLDEPPAWAVLERDRVVALSDAARAAGVRPGMRAAGAAVLAPQVRLLARDEAAERRAFDRAAQAALRYTPMVAQAPQHTLLLDVGASLRLFGGPRALLRQARRDVAGLGLAVRAGMAPTAAGAWLLACRREPRARRRVLRQAALDAALDTLPIDLLPQAAPHLDWLSGSGCRTLGMLRRLPRAALQRRSGPDLLRALDAAYGRQAEAHRAYQPPASFTERIDLVERLEHAEAVLAMAGRLAASLCAWLAARRQAVRSLSLGLEHEHGRHARPPSVIELALAEPAWLAPHLLGPLRERIARCRLAAPVVALTLDTRELADAPDLSAGLFPEPGGTPADQRRLLDLLAARLGSECVRRPAPRADHRPEVANAWTAAWSDACTDAPTRVRTGARASAHPDNAHTGARTDARTNAKADARPNAPPAAAAPHGESGPPPERPFWLLAQPQELPVRGHRPVAGTPLTLLRGPERIESGWWDAPMATRDYFVAEDARHARYWVYRERDADPVRWFLHGLFG